MILPTKHINISRSLLGMGAEVLDLLDKPSNVSALWYKVKLIPEINTFENYTLVLDFLFMLGAIEYKKGFINKK